MTMRPEAVADLFDLPPPEAVAEADESAAKAMDAAEAALAAEFAAEIDAGVVASDAPDSRRNSRVAVSWSARMRLAGGQVIDLQVRNISATGVGLASREHVPADAVLAFAMNVPSPDGDGAPGIVRGTIRTTYAVEHDAEIRFGGAWVELPATDRQLLDTWLGRLER